MKPIPPKWFTHVKADTDEALAPIGKYADTKKFVLRNNDTGIPRGEGYHLYLTSQEDVKAGDWIVRDKTLCITVCDDNIKEKVIASTNPKLIKEGIPTIPEHIVYCYVKIMNKPKHSLATKVLFMYIREFLNLKNS